MTTSWVRALAAGAAFGLAVACVDTVLGARRLLQFSMGAPARVMVLAALAELALGAALGLVLAPLRRLRTGSLLHALGLAAAWAALELYAAPGGTTPMLIALVLLPPAAGLVLLAAGRLAARRLGPLPVVLGLFLIAVAIATPEVAARLRAPVRSPPPPAVPARPGAPDVVVVVLDTVRADHVSAYGYARPTTPHFDALVAEGALFLDASAPANWSLPSHASLFTGRFPSGHGAHIEHRFLDAETPTLAEVFRAAGYDTRSFTANAWISDALGLTRGFLWTDEAWRDAAVGRDFLFVYRLLDKLGLGLQDKGGADVAGHFETWLAGRGADARPAFVFVNFIEAHFPYHQLPAESLRRFTRRPLRELRGLSLALLAEQFGDAGVDPARARGPATDMYDAGVRYADALLGRIVEALRANGRLDRSVLMVLADHGELLGEHGVFGHGRSLTQAELHVPWLLRYPPRVAAGVRVEEPVSTAGAYETLLELAGLASPGTAQVSSLVPSLHGGRVEEPVLAERFAMRGQGLLASTRSDPLLRGDRRFRAYRHGAEKLVETSDGERFLFDLRADPSEGRDLSRAQPERADRLQHQLEALRKRLRLPRLDAVLGAGVEPELDRATRERLRALGYVE